MCILHCVGAFNAPLVKHATYVFVYTVLEAGRHMKIHLINPNTTVSMTQGALVAAQSVAASGTEIIGNQPAHGPVSIEGFYDEVFAVPEMIAEVIKHNNCDGHVIACFDDTGVDAARCIANGPVIGICEAGCLVMNTIANSFSIVTTLRRSVPALTHLVHKYGADRRCVSIRASDIPVLELEKNDDAYQQLAAECRRAIETDGAEAILLGCAGMTHLAQKLSDEFSLPVVDGVTAAVKHIEGLVSMNLTTSRVNGYKKPVVKEYKGNSSQYAFSGCD